MNQHAFNVLELDPADYPVRLPSGRVIRPDSSAAMLAAEEEPQADDPPESPFIRVAYTGPGVWARFTGVNRATGEDVTIAAAIIAGPTELPDGRLAVLLDLYDLDRTRLPLVVAQDAWCELVDDTEDEERQLAHVVAPVFGAGAEQVHLLRHRPGTRPGRAGQWTPEHLTNVTGEQLRELEHDPGVFLTGVHHNPIPIRVDGGVL